MTPKREHPSRRTLLQSAGALAGFGGALTGPAQEPELPPVRAITRGPKFHWFGYYDKLEFDPAQRYVLGMEVDFEHRSPRPDDVIRVGMVDLADNDRWIDLGESRAWGWQQGCMLQWLPGSAAEIIWNDRQDGQFVSHILNVKTGKKRTLPSAIYAVAPDGQWAVSADFRRINDTRPGYGYSGIADPNSNVLAPENSGIWRVDLMTGKSELIFSIADAAARANPHADFRGVKHYFNHLLVSPGGGRFIFLHRWRGEKGQRGFRTRMFTADPDGGRPYILDPYGRTSHFIWRDPAHVLAWAHHPSHGSKFYLYTDHTEKVSVVAPEVMPKNGHCTYLPGKRWILSDTYPDETAFSTPTSTRSPRAGAWPLGHFHSPPEYAGEWRCDNHPRYSPDGKKVVIDSPHGSPHGGNGRQLHLIDISEIVA